MTTSLPTAWMPARPAVLATPDAAAAWAPEEFEGVEAFGDAVDVPPADEVEPPAGPSAEELLADAEARRLALEAAERARLVAEAYAAGRAEGEAAVRAADAGRVRTAVDAAEAALARVQEGERRWTELLEENVCALAVAVARQVIGRELAGDRTSLTELVRRALAEFPLDQAVTVRLHPADLAVLADAGASAGESVAPTREARWIADAHVAPGGCMVEGRERIIDGRVDTALERVYRQLTGNHA